MHVRSYHVHGVVWCDVVRDVLSRFMWCGVLRVLVLCHVWCHDAYDAARSVSSSL